MYFFASLMRSRWRSTNLLQKFFLREKKNIVFSLDMQGCKLQQILSQKGKGFFGFKTKKFKLGGFATKKFPVSRKTSPCKRKNKHFLSTSFFRFLTKISSLVNPLKLNLLHISVTHRKSYASRWFVTLSRTSFSEPARMSTHSKSLFQRKLLLSNLVLVIVVYGLPYAKQGKKSILSDQHGCHVKSSIPPKNFSLTYMLM